MKCVRQTLKEGIGVFKPFLIAALNFVECIFNLAKIKINNLTLVKTNST